MIYEIWKKIGETPLEALERFRLEQNIDSSEKVTFAGRLDPMAEGIMNILTGESVHQKDDFTNKDKEYEVEFLIGFKTDTYDLLGLIKEKKYEHIEKDNLFKKIPDYVKDNTGKIEQKYPPYSSKPVNGKPLFMWAREGKLDQINIPSHEVEIYEAELNSEAESIGGNPLLEKIKDKISLVKGDFRQDDILQKWKQSISTDKIYSILKIKLVVSSGTYVRQYINDMSDSIGLPLVVFSIKRTRVF